MQTQGSGTIFLASFPGHRHRWEPRVAYSRTTHESWRLVFVFDLAAALQPYRTPTSSAPATDICERLTPQVVRRGHLTGAVTSGELRDPRKVDNAKSLPQASPKTTVMRCAAPRLSDVSAAV